MFACTLAWGPREAADVPTSTLVPGWRAALTNHAFLAVAALRATALLGHHQMYLALPWEVERATDSQDLLGALFATAAVVTIVVQVPLARWARGVGACWALPLGSVVTAAGLGVVAAANAVPLPAWVPTLGPAVAFVVLLHVGLALSGPVVRDLVAVLARERALGAHYGLLASAGGLAVLLGSAGIGAVSQPGAATPWAVCGLLCLCSTVGYAALLRRTGVGR